MSVSSKDGGLSKKPHPLSRQSSLKGIKEFFKSVFFSSSGFGSKLAKSLHTKPKIYYSIQKNNNIQIQSFVAFAGTAPLQLVKLELAVAQSSTGIANFYRKEAAKPRILNSDV